LSPNNTTAEPILFNIAPSRSGVIHSRPGAQGAQDRVVVPPAGDHQAFLSRAINRTAIRLSMTTNERLAALAEVSYRV
jgi:hypothetical protein